MLTVLEKAQLAMSAARRKLNEVLDDDEVWADDSKYVSPDMIVTASLLDMPVGQVAGLIEVNRRVAAVRGTTRSVRNLEKS